MHKCENGLIHLIMNNEVIKLTEFLVVEEVEEGHADRAYLNDGSDAAVLGLLVLVAVPPPGAATGAAPVDGVLGPAGEPTWQLAQFDLGQRGVR